MLNASTKFKAAHIITRNIMQDGDDYRATFGLVLKMLNGWCKCYAQSCEWNGRGTGIESVSIWKGRRLYLNIRAQNRFGGANCYLDLEAPKFVANFGACEGAQVAKTMKNLDEAAYFADIEN